MSDLFAIVMPIIPGQKERWDMFMEKIRGEYWDDFCQCRSDAGLRERTFLQPTPMGDMVIVTLEGENPADTILEVFKQDTPFMQWFRNEVNTIHGVDFSQPFDGPRPQMVADSGM